MIKINPSIKKDSESVRNRSKSTNAVKSSSIFSKILSSAVEPELSVEEMMSDLADQEKKFLDSQTMVELENYKRKVKKILSLIMSDGFEVHSVKNKRRNKEFVLVKRIDEKLLSLTRLVASRDNKAFSLFKELEEIRGLILDFLH